MNNTIDNDEYKYITNEILSNHKFLELMNIKHHGITRYEHCFRVSYYTYLVTKFLRLNYVEATEAALLHDFFIDEVQEEGGISRLRKHPKYALNNAKEYFELTPMQEDIIKTHMFPVTFTPPKYLESWIVDIIDDISAVYERCLGLKKQCQVAYMFITVLIISFTKKM